MGLAGYAGDPLYAWVWRHPDTILNDVALHWEVVERTLRVTKHEGLLHDALLMAIALTASWQGDQVESSLEVKCIRVLPTGVGGECGCGREPANGRPCYTWSLGCGFDVFPVAAGDLLLLLKRIIYCHLNPCTCRKRRLRGGWTWGLGTSPTSVFYSSKISSQIKVRGEGKASPIPKCWCF